MIEHIVMWRFKAENKTSNMARLRAMLEELPNKIPELKKLTCGVHENPTAPGWDMVLIVHVDNWADLATYAGHPAHRAVSAFCSTIREERAVVDRMLAPGTK